MNTIVREINGVKGFCMYRNGQPYTYIYTRDAIKMLGLVQFKNGKKYIRISDFGSSFVEIIKSERISSLINDIGINLTPNFKISQIKESLPSHHDGKANPPVPSSIYDNILPEYILDKVIFMIVNRMRSQTAQDFRESLFMDIIPHFQQTATRDQIAKVPILNQTTQFMYDNTSYSTLSQQSYIFAKQILDMHLNRLAILTDTNNIDDVFAKTTKEYNNILRANEENDLIYYLETYIAHSTMITGIKYEMNLQNLKDCIIFNYKIYNEFISFLIHEIRNQEIYCIMEMNGETLVRKVVHEPSGNVEEYDQVEYKEPNKISPVRFLNMDEMTGLYR